MGLPPKQQAALSRVSSHLHGSENLVLPFFLAALKGLALLLIEYLPPSVQVCTPSRLVLEQLFHISATTEGILKTADNSDRLTNLGRSCCGHGCAHIFDDSHLDR